MKTSNAVRLVPSTLDLSSAPKASRREALDTLFEQASRGDREAIETVAIVYRWIIIGIAREALGPHAQDAEDILQEFMLLLLEGRCPYDRGVAAPSRWLRETVWGLARTWRAQRWREP